jgi:uncharacterized membrane protein
MMIALLLGLVAGMRTMMPPAAVSVAAWLGWLPLRGTALAFMAMPVSVVVFVLAAAAELVVDAMPFCPSRKAPGGFAARLVSGGFCGAAVQLASGSWVAGLLAGAVGALAGTLLFHAARARLAARLGRDLPAALIEDLVAIAGAAAIIAIAR